VHEYIPIGSLDGDQFVPIERDDLLLKHIAHMHSSPEGVTMTVDPCGKGVTMPSHISQLCLHAATYAS
jgi:hypothetical protein